MPTPWFSHQQWCGSLFLCVVVVYHTVHIIDLWSKLMLLTYLNTYLVLNCYTNIESLYLFSYIVSCVKISHKMLLQYFVTIQWRFFYSRFYNLIMCVILTSDAVLIKRTDLLKKKKIFSCWTVHTVHTTQYSADQNLFL